MNDLVKTQRCILVRGGIELWIDSEKADILAQKWANAKSSFPVIVEGRSINSADIVGIFHAEDIEKKTRHANGQWECKQGVWHDRGEKCACATQEEKEKYRAYCEEYRRDHGWLPLTTFEQFTGRQ